MPFAPTLAKKPDHLRLGEQRIREGKVAALILAGGDGSRLGWKGPKGTFPVSLVKKKTLFQLMAERIVSASRYYNQSLKAAVMTSPRNHDATQKALPHMELFPQGVLPLLDLQKRPLEERRPCGNGDLIRAFYASGLFEKWRREGIEWVQTVQIDNPLADPFDSNLAGLDADVALKTVLKQGDESVGVVGEKGGRLTVVEYSENPPLEWNLANTSLFSFSMDFIDRVKEHPLPLHFAEKSINGKRVLKQEYFLFDLLPLSKKTEILLCERGETFAPLKGAEDLPFVQRALLERDRRAFYVVSGQECKEIFELDSAFYYPTEELKKRWQGKKAIEGSYIEP